MKHILTVFLSLAILLSLSGCSTNEISQSSSQSASTELSAEEQKNVAESADLQISTAVEMSKNYYDVLSERMDGLETGEFSMLDVYTTCEEMKEYLRGFRDHVDEVEDENAEDYKDAAKSYIANISVIADDVMAYVDNGEISTLSDIQEGVRLISYCQTMVDEARENYLALYGITGEEQESEQESADHSTKEAMDCLTAFYPAENIQGVSVQTIKIEADILYADTVDSVPADWDSVQATAMEASTSLQSVASADGIQYGVIYLVDGQGNNLLTAMNGKISYDSFAEAVEYAGSNPPTITLEEFNAIQEGMTYQEVTDIVGSSGELRSESGMSGSDYYTQLRSWEGEGSLGANANVMFQGGKVISKAQFGLE